MRNMFFVALMLLHSTAVLCAQPTFKAGFKTYATVMVVHEFSYNYNPADSSKLLVAVDSIATYVASDSAVTMTEYYNNREKAMYKTVNYFSQKKQLIKTENYKDENLLESNEWAYDDKNRKIAHNRTNKLNNNLYKKLFEYSTDKKSGETVVTESSYFNGKIEFYTKSYYNKANEKYKEVRLNDNNKDVVHIESYTYGENGKVKERSVYFPEFKVTKKFDEPAGNIPAKCYGMKPMIGMEKMNPTNKILYIKRTLAKNNALIADPTCNEFEYTFSNNINCTVTVACSKASKLKTVRYRFKEKL